MKPKQKKPKKRRDSVQHPALNKRYMPRVRQELIDYDYLDQLSPEEKDWLNKFTDEYVNASFQNDGTDIQSYEQYGKDCNDRNNARNRCLYTDLRNKGDGVNNKKLLNYDNMIVDVENQLSQDINPNSLENAYTEYIELKEIESFLEEYDQAMLLFREETSELLEYQSPLLLDPTETLKS